MATIGTHSGAFQADEALGVWMLKKLPQYAHATVIRTRDLEKLAPLTIVLDVGALYDHTKLRYDHHQRGFFETFDGPNPAMCDGGRPDVTGPETAAGEFKTKLSASGLVYKHYGREIICALHPSLSASPDKLEWVYKQLYANVRTAPRKSRAFGPRVLLSPFARAIRAAVGMQLACTQLACAQLACTQLACTPGPTFSGRAHGRSPRVGGVRSSWRASMPTTTALRSPTRRAIARRPRYRTVCIG